MPPTRPASLPRPAGPDLRRLNCVEIFLRISSWRLMKNTGPDLPHIMANQYRALMSVNKRLVMFSNAANETMCAEYSWELRNMIASRKSVVRLRLQSGTYRYTAIPAAGVCRG